MTNVHRLYKILFATVISLFGLITIYALQAEETPRFVLFFGRFHPLLLHLPIGALLVTFFIDVIGRIQKNYASEIIKSMLGFTAFFAIITCFIGYFLSLEGGYQEETLNLHLYTGIGTAILVSGLFYLSLEENFESNKLFLPLFLISLVCISVAGHFGSVLTHGNDFLLEYARAPQKEKTIEVVDSLKIYDNVVAKILDDKCVSCHNTNKRKGDLSLISKNHILQGGESGEVLIAGNADASLFYTQLLLPISDEDRMPPEGKAQLTKDEIWILKHWIDNGLDFDNYVQGISENDTLKTKLEKYLVFNKLEIPKASRNDIEKVRASGFRVLEIVPGQSELSVKYLDAEPDKERIDKLSLLSEQVVELNFGSAQVTDEMTNVLRRLENLKSLRLNSPSITDASINNLKSLESVEVLNVYNTGITRDGLADLLSVITPKKVYTWETEIDQESAEALASNFNINIVNGAGDELIEGSKLEVPLITPDNTLFMKEMDIVLSTRLKGVDLRYTLDGASPDSTSPVFSDKITLTDSGTLKVAAFKENWVPSDVITRDYAKVQHRIADFSIEEEPSERFADPKQLFDLEEGSLSFGDGKWAGFLGSDLTTTIDLGSDKVVEHISFSTLEDVGSWILYPTKFLIYASNTKDGEFAMIDEVSVPRQGEGGAVEKKKVTLTLPKTKARYFKIVIKNRDALPEWHVGAGNPGWIFVDEIFVW